MESILQRLMLLEQTCLRQTLLVIEMVRHRCLPYRNSKCQQSTLTLTSPKTSFSVYASPNSISTAYQAVQNIPWGIFYLNTSNATPEFTYHYTWAHDEYGYPYEVYEGFSKEVNFPAGFFNSSLSINPAIANDISKVEIINGAGFTSISDFDLSPRKIWGNYNSYDVYIGLKITFNNGIIIYQRFPL